jgi:2-C-methyl-D-erythritol 2,4-cyclodiphosphate synthase
MTTVGLGWDIHRLVENRPLILGGVTIPYEKGLLGHSDADVLCHAVTDALLGASALGDIGEHFPDTDPSYRGASSLMLLGRIVELIRKEGWNIVNVDATVICERPKLSAYKELIRRSLAGTLGIPADRVSIKAKTKEGLGPEGTGEAMSALAAASLEK